MKPAEPFDNLLGLLMDDEKAARDDKQQDYDDHDPGHGICSPVGAEHMFPREWSP